MSNFFADESGAGLVEYALIMGLVSITVIVMMVFMRDQLNHLFSNIGNTLMPSAGDPCVGQQQQGQCP